MSMGMSMSHSVRQEQRVVQSMRLSHAQRLQLGNHIFALRTSLIQELRDERYDPKGTCPNCEKKLTPVEIINGFNQDPNDFTTRCPGCSQRFEPRLICFSNGISLELPFFCDMQTLDQLRGKESLSPEQLAHDHPAIYRAAIVHHGGIKGAFATIGVEYRYTEIHDWKSKVRPFLGRLPDTQIAECATVSVAAIRAMRRELGIQRYRVNRSLEEIDEGN